MTVLSKKHFSSFVDIVETYFMSDRFVEETMKRLHEEFPPDFIDEKVGKVRNSTNLDAMFYQVQRWYGLLYGTSNELFPEEIAVFHSAHGRVFPQKFAEWGHVSTKLAIFENLDGQFYGIKNLAVNFVRFFMI